MADQQATLGLILELKAKTDELKNANKDILSLKNALDSVGDGFGSIASGFTEGLGIGGALSVVGLLTSAISGAVSEMKSLVTEGLNLNAAMETAQFSIAGALRQFFPERFKDFNSALKGSGEVIDLLRAKSVELGLSFDSLSHVYQASVGSLFKAGVYDLNQQIKLVADLQRVLASQGITGARAARDTADLFNGQINRVVALKGLGFSKEGLDQAKETGTAFEYIEEHLKGYNEAADAAAETTERLEQKLSNTKTQVFADQTKDLSASFKELLRTLLDLVNSDGFKQTAKFIGDVASLAVKGATGLVQVGKSLNDAATGNSKKDPAFDSTVSVLQGAGGPGGFATLLVATEKVREAFDFIRDDIKNTPLGKERQAEQATTDANSQRIRDTLKKVDDTQKANNAGPEEAAARLRVAEEEAGAQLEKNASKAEILRQKLELVGLKDEERLSTLKQIVTETNAEFDAKLSKATGPNQLALIEQERKKALLPILTQIASVEAKITAEQDAQQKKADAAVDRETKRLEKENARLEIEKARATLQDLDQQKAEIQNDFLLTRQQKEQETLELLKKEPAAIDEIIARLRVLQNATKDDAAKQQIDTEINSLQKRKGQVPGEINRQGPQGTTQQIQAGLVQLQDSFVTISQTISGTIGNAFSTISSNISGLILRTQTWGQALRGIASTILTDVVNAIVQASVQWVARKLIEFTIGKTLATASTAVTAGQAIATGALWAVPATLASIATFGGADIAGVAALQGALAAAPLAAIGLADGGPVSGPGGSRTDSIPARLSNGEYVLNARSVQQIGVDRLNAVNFGGRKLEDVVGRGGISQASQVAPGGATAGSGSGAQGSKQLHVAVFDDRQAMTNYLKTSEGEAHVIRIVNNNTHKINLG